MNWSYSAYAAILFTAAATSMAVAIEIWQRRNAPGGWAMFILETGVTIWSATYAFHWLSPNPEIAHFWLDATYLGVVTAPTAFLIFVLQFTFKGRFLNKWRIALLWLEPVLTFLIVFSSPLHNLFHTADQALHLHNYYTGGFWFWFNAIYSYIIIFVSLILLLLAAVRGHFNYRRQALMVFIGGGLPWLGSIITFSGLNPFQDLDLTPILFTISGIIFAVALSRYQLLKIVPIARYNLVESMTDGVIVLDEQKIIVDINPATLRLINIPYKQLIGERFDSIFASHSELSALCCDEQNHQREIQWVQDPPLWLDIRLNVLRSKKEYVDGWLLILRDITELKNTQLDLQQSEQRYRYLLESAAFPVLITSQRDRTVLYANQRTMELFEFTEKPVGRVVPNYYQNPADRDKLLQQLALDKQVNNFEVGLKTDTGRLLWVLLTANLIEFDQQAAIFVAINDITARRLMEQEMRNLQRAVEQSANTILITDTDGNIVFVNPAFTTTSGYAASEVLGKNPRILKSGAQTENYYHELWSTIKSNESWQGTFHNRRKDGSLYWEAATISPIRDADGSAIHYIAVKEDITARKEAEEEL